MYNINWNEPKFYEEEIELVSKVLKSGYVSEGPMTKKLEEELACILGVKHVIMTTSCTSALYLAIEADKRIRGYSKGEVVIPDLTFVATKNAVEMAGLTPDIRDVRKDNFMLDTCKLNKNTKIIIPVNLLGRDSSEGPMPKDYKYTVIYDNAGALGSDVPNGNVGCYSLQGNKLISCGQGGFCATDDDEYAKEIRKIKDFGRDDKYQNDSVGFNFKFNDILAAVAIGQLQHIEGRKEQLINQYKYYKKNLKDCGKFVDFKLTEVPLWVEFICEDRDKLFEHLELWDISCRKPWKPLTGLDNSKDYSENCLWLPNGPNLTNYNLNTVIRKIKDFYDESN